MLSAALDLEADRDLCVKCMVAQPDCIRHVKKSLTNLGFINEDDTLSSTITGDQAACHRLEQWIKNSKQATAKKHTDDMMTSPPPASPSVATQEQLNSILERCEPVSLSHYAMKGALRKGQRRVPKTFLLEVLEYISRDPKDADWTKLETFGEVVNHYVEMNQNTGRRARELQMPVSWPDHGIYEVFKAADIMMLRHRFTGEENSIHDTILLKGVENVDVHSFQISKNFSETQAMVSRIGCVPSVPCVQIIPLKDTAQQAPLALLDGVANEEAPFQTPPSKRQRLALQDGDLGERRAAPRAAAAGSSPQAPPQALSPRTPADGDTAGAATAAASSSSTGSAKAEASNTAASRPEEAAGATSSARGAADGIDHAAGGAALADKAANEADEEGGGDDDNEDDGEGDEDPEADENAAEEEENFKM